MSNRSSLASPAGSHLASCCPASTWLSGNNVHGISTNRAQFHHCPSYWRHPSQLLLYPRDNSLFSPVPIPARLVEQIKTGEFVDMKELLGDNISLLKCTEEVQGQMGVATQSAHVGLSNMTRLREVPPLSHGWADSSYLQQSRARTATLHLC